jgi:hypothetical protein
LTRVSEVVKIKELDSTVLAFSPKRAWQLLYLDYREKLICLAAGASFFLFISLFYAVLSGSLAWLPTSFFLFRLAFSNFPKIALKKPPGFRIFVLRVFRS